MLRPTPYRNHKYFGRSIASLTAVLLGYLLTGCTSIQIQANKDEASVKKIKRLFVVIKHGDFGRQPYSNELASGLRNAFTNTPWWWRSA